MPCVVLCILECEVTSVETARQRVEGGVLEDRRIDLAIREYWKIDG